MKVMVKLETHMQDFLQTEKYLKNEVEKLEYLNKPKKNVLETGIVELFDHFEGKITAKNTKQQFDCIAMVISKVLCLSDAFEGEDFLEEQNIFVLTHNLVKQNIKFLCFCFRLNFNFMNYVRRFQQCSIHMHWALNTTTSTLAILAYYHLLVMMTFIIKLYYLVRKCYYKMKTEKICFHMSKKFISILKQILGSRHFQT